MQNLSAGEMQEIIYIARTRVHENIEKFRTVENVSINRPGEMQIDYEVEYLTEYEFGGRKKLAWCAIDIEYETVRTKKPFEQNSEEKLSEAYKQVFGHKISTKHAL